MVEGSRHEREMETEQSGRRKVGREGDLSSFMNFGSRVGQRGVIGTHQPKPS